MMRSLWSGVSGLQSHQIAMDVEGDNIANVNTVGFKYSRVNFADLYNQTSKVATGPEGKMGGQNAMQVGLGTQITATTTIHKQGSLENTDKQTDLAINGNGFFVLSGDGGKNYVYTRNGDFTRDSLGNFVNSEGYIVQGWMADKDYNIDPTTPLKSINIPAGLNIAAKATSEVAYYGNLDSGDDVGTAHSPIYSLDSWAGWIDRNENSIKEEKDLLGSTATTENDTSHGEYYVDDDNVVRMMEKGVDLGIIFNASGEAVNLSEGQGFWVSYADAKATFGDGVNPIAGQGDTIHINLNGIEITGSVDSVSDVANMLNNYTVKTGIVASVINGNQLQLVNQNNIGTTATSKNIKLYSYADDGLTNHLDDTAVITAYQYTYSTTSTSATHSYNDEKTRNVHTTEDLREAMQEDARLWVDYQGDRVDYAASGSGRSAETAWNGAPQHGEPASTNNEYSNNTYATRNRNDGVTVTVNNLGQFEIANPASDAYNWDDADSNTYLVADDNSVIANDNRPGVGIPIDYIGNDDTHTNDFAMNINVTGLTNSSTNVMENSSITSIFSALGGGLSNGSSTTKTSQAITMASHSMTTEIYDSLGSKHTLSIEFRKVGYSAQNGTEWSLLIQVPTPGVINDDSDTSYQNVVLGSLKFGPDGSLLSYTPTSITYSPNNGAAAGQTVSLNFGTLGAYDGVTSYDDDSATSNIVQDGYTGGTLKGISIDETGKIIGAFTNGKSKALAQVGIASFTNYEGLEKIGGSLFISTANSGNAVVGAAGTASRGAINASTLEMSNVDLSRSLTQLIVVQRGYQANSKTITTSDEMLNTLLQLK